MTVISADPAFSTLRSPDHRLAICVAFIWIVMLSEPNNA